MNKRSKDKRISADVLVLGGGLAGCLAAIKAAEQGAKVVIFEKSHIDRSGNGGTGLHRIPLIHPDYNYSFGEFAKLNVNHAAGLCDEDVSYQFAKDSLDRVLDLESYGIQVRKDDGSFIFKDAADISPGNVVIWGPGPTVWHNMKPTLARQARKGGAKVFNRTAAIGLLTEDGEVGGRAAGAVGLNTRTGQFVVCTAKAVVLTSGGSYRAGRHKDTLYAPSRFLECGCPANSGDGQFMAYRAGADLVNLEFLKFSPAWKDFAHWGIGPIMEGEEIKGDGEVLAPLPGEQVKLSRYKQTYTFGFDTEGLFEDASSIPGFPEPRDEMLEFMWAEQNEATSLAYRQYKKEREEDFTKGPIEFEWHPPYLHNNQAGIYMAANAASSLKGLYCAGDVMGGGYRQSAGGALVFGARAGRNAAVYARQRKIPKLSQTQIQSEKAPITAACDVHPADGYSWVELEDKARQIISEYGAPFTSDPKLERGLHHLERIKRRYLGKLYARNPREMLRASEVQSVFFLAEAHLRCALYRKESRSPTVSILYKRQWPQQDDKNWLKHTVLRHRQGAMRLSKRKVKRLQK